MQLSYHDTSLPYMVSQMLTFTFTGAVRRFCYRPGQPCSKVKRTAETIAEAIAEPAAEPEPEAWRTRTFCYRPGQPCSKVKRALDGLASAVEKI